MKEGFTFNQGSLNVLRKFTSKNFAGGGGGNRKEPISFESYGQFLRKSKKVGKGLTFQSYDSDEFAHTGAPSGVE